MFIVSGTLTFRAIGGLTNLVTYRQNGRLLTSLHFETTLRLQLVQSVGSALETKLLDRIILRVGISSSVHLSKKTL